MTRRRTCKLPIDILAAAGGMRGRGISRRRSSSLVLGLVVDAAVPQLLPYLVWDANPEPLCLFLNITNARVAQPLAKWKLIRKGDANCIVQRLI
jgi:hypothetical protein